jgi:hypothetical protein
MPSLTITFIGVTVRLVMPAERDVVHLRYYLLDHLGEPGGEPVTLRIRAEAEDGGSFVAALGATVTNRIWWHTASAGWTLYEEFRRRSVRPSLIPPFGVDPLRSRIRTRHGAAVAAPDGSARALALIGGSGAGKSVAMMHLLRIGWRFISDDVLILGRDNRDLYYYGRPIGVRQRSLPLFPWLGQNDLAGATCLGTQWGHTYMVRPERLGMRADISTPTVLTWRIHLTRGGVFAVRRDGATAYVDWDPHHHLSQLLELCTELTGLRGASVA